MGWILSLPVLVVLGWAMAGLVWGHLRHGFIAAPMMPFAITGMALVAAAMGLLLATVPAPVPEQLVRVALLVEGAVGIVILARRTRGGRDRGRR